MKEENGQVCINIEFNKKLKKAKVRNTKTEEKESSEQKLILI
jgi:hypothetical protein